MTYEEIDPKYLITRKFNKNIREQIIEELDKLNILPPDDEKMFRNGHSGNMLFLEDYGMVVKIETKTSHYYGSHKIVRAVDPDILQPIFQKRIRNITIDLIPGLDLTSLDEKETSIFKTNLKKRNIDLWDGADRNIAKMPNGTLITIDTFAAYDELLSEGTKLSGISAVKEVINNRKEKFKNCPQDIIYRPLRIAFKKAYESGDKKQMKKAWELCKEFKENNILFSGWTKYDRKSSEYDENLIGPSQVAIQSKLYARKLKQQALSS